MKIPIYMHVEGVPIPITDINCTLFISNSDFYRKKVGNFEYFRVGLRRNDNPDLINNDIYESLVSNILVTNQIKTKHDIYALILDECNKHAIIDKIMAIPDDIIKQKIIYNYKYYSSIDTFITEYKGAISKLKLIENTIISEIKVSIK